MDNNKKEKRGYQAPIGWWTPWIRSTSRIYLPWNATPHGWCFPTQRSRVIPPRDSAVRGLLYIKSHKASSSTCAGVNIAIAHHVARRKFSLPSGNDTLCEHYDTHTFHKHKLYAKGRIPRKSLLWSFVRNPVSRDLSQLYHFAVTRQALDPENNAASLLRILKRGKGRQVRYLSLQEGDVEMTNDTESQASLSTSLRNKLLEPYDFIGVVERMAESLAVMTLLWDLDPTDVIVLSAKQSSNGDNYDDGRFQNTCFKLIPAPKNMSDLQPDLANYLQSEEYIQTNPDFLLYYAAHESLDRTIEALGRDKVEERTQVIQKLQSLADQQCQKEAIYPCSNEGIPQTELSEQNCYANDAGCGYACVDRLMSDYRNGHVNVL